MDKTKTMETVCTNHTLSKERNREMIIVDDTTVTLEDCENICITAKGNARVNIMGWRNRNIMVMAYDDSDVYVGKGGEEIRVHAHDNVTVNATQTEIFANENAKVVATDGRVHGYNNSHVVAKGRANVSTFDECLVEAWDGTMIFALDNCEVHAHDTAEVFAADGVFVKAYDNARVADAKGCACVMAYGEAEVTAREHCDVYLHQNSTAEVTDEVRVKATGQNVRVVARGGAVVYAHSPCVVEAHDYATVKYYDKNVDIDIQGRGVHVVDVHAQRRICQEKEKK